MCKKLKLVLHVRKCTLNNTTQISQSKQDVLDNSINIQETEYHDNVAVVVAGCPVSRSLSAAFRRTLGRKVSVIGSSATTTEKGRKKRLEPVAVVSTISQL